MPNFSFQCTKNASTLLDSNDCHQTISLIYRVVLNYMCTVARIFIDGRGLHIKRTIPIGTVRLVRPVPKFKQRTNVPYPYYYKKRVPYKRTVRPSLIVNYISHQSWSRGHNLRDQGQRLEKKSEAKDRVFEDRPSRG